MVCLTVSELLVASERKVVVAMSPDISTYCWADKEASTKQMVINRKKTTAFQMRRLGSFRLADSAPRDMGRRYYLCHP